MKKKQKTQKKNWQHHLFTWLAFAVGFVTCCFSRFTFNMFFCAFIFPFCFLFFNRRVKWYIGIPLTLVGLFGGCCVAFYRMFLDNPVTKVWAMPINFIAALASFLPYIFDKVVYQKFFETRRPILFSFMFPLTWLTIDIILGLTLAGTYLSLGYALCQILQAVSVLAMFGIHFLTFIIVYFGSALTSFLTDIHKNWKQLVISASTLGFSGLYSGITQAIPATSQMIKVATSEYFGFQHSTTWESQITADVQKASEENANVLVYPELCFNPANDLQYTNLQTTIKNLTNEYRNLLVLLPVENDNRTEKGKNYNEVWFVINGEIRKIYRKQRPFFPTEGARTPGDGVKYWDLTIGRTKCRVGAVICYDLEFPEVSAQAGRLGVDVLFAPSWDNPSFGMYRSDVNAFRGIETGCNFVKVTEGGWTLACDYKGRVYENYFRSEEERTPPELHIFDMPAKRGFALYPWLNYFIDYFYPAGLAGVLITSGVLNLKDKKRKPSK